MVWLAERKEGSSFAVVKPLQCGQEEHSIIGSKTATSPQALGKGSGTQVLMCFPSKVGLLKGNDRDIEETKMDLHEDDASAGVILVRI